MRMKRLDPILSHSPAIIENDYRAYIPWPVTVPDSPLNFHLAVTAVTFWHVVSPHSSSSCPIPSFVLPNLILHPLLCSSWGFIIGLVSSEGIAHTCGQHGC